MGAGFGGLPDASASPRATTDDGPTAVAADVAAVYGAHPDLSSDGRWVVYAGLPTDDSGRNSTVWLADTRSPDAAPVELTVPVDGIRTGDSVMPAISGDGCFAVVVTEMAYDFFRDDDEDQRWDVYRLELPQCLADPAQWQPADWELVSTETNENGEATALDRATPADPPAVSESGAVVAYTQQAQAGHDPLLSVTVVDLTVPLGDSTRASAVRGTPNTLPATTFSYVGQHEPAVSADGRIVVFTSDARSDLLVPSWATGPVEGERATSQVYLWDRLETDSAKAVTMVSAEPRPAPPSPTDPAAPPVIDTSPAVPSDRGAEGGDVSSTGDFVVFSSSSTDLIDGLSMPACVDTCPTQVYRYDRLTRSNVLVSRQVGADGASPGAAADLGASQPTISEDGSQIGFVTRATNLFTTAAIAGTEPGDGEIVVALVDLGELSRVSVLADGVTPAAGTNAHPVLSATGSVIVFDTLSAHDLVGSDAPGRQVVSLRRRAQVAAPDLDVGTVVVGYPGPEWRIGVKNLGPSTWIPAVVTSSNQDFAVTGGTCSLGVPMLPGEYCEVKIVLTPSVAGPITGELTVSEAGDDPVSVTSELSGQGGEPLLNPKPAGADFANTIVGEESPTVTVDITNIGFSVGTVARITMSGANPDDFKVKSDRCIAEPMIPGGSCAFEVAFTPTAAGYRTATALVVTDTGQYTGVLLDGTGRFEPTVTVAADAVVAGDPIGIGGSGFAPFSEVTISWADGSGNAASVVTNKDGGFLLLFETRRNERAGERQLVVQGSDSAFSATVHVQRPGAAAGPGSPVWGG